MIYILSLFFVLAGLVNLARGRNIKIRTGINKMDLISMVLVALIFVVAARLLRAEARGAVAITVGIIFYMATTRYARGITERGVIISGGNPLLLREYLFSEIKQVNVSNDGDLVSFAVVIKDRNYVDIQRYPKEKKPDLIQIFKENHVMIIYK